MPGSPPKPPMSRRKTAAIGLAVVAAGLYPLAVATGLATARPGSVHAPLWVVGLTGACFVLAGTLILIPERQVRLRGFAVGVLVSAFAVIFDWVAFGPGERSFSGSLSFGGLALHSGGGALGGRIAFGGAALVMDAFALWVWYRWLRGPAPSPGSEPRD